MTNLSSAVWRKSSRSTGSSNCVEVAALAGARWRKSSRSNSNSNCVEVADNLPGVVAVRDSKHPAGPAVVFTPGERDAFVGGVKHGEFDLG